MHTHAHANAHTHTNTKTLTRTNTRTTPPARTFEVGSYGGGAPDLAAPDRQATRGLTGRADRGRGTSSVEQNLDGFQVVTKGGKVEGGEAEVITDQGDVGPKADQLDHRRRAASKTGGMKRSHAEAVGCVYRCTFRNQLGDGGGPTVSCRNV